MRHETSRKIIDRLIIALIVVSPFLYMKSTYDKLNLPKLTFIHIVSVLMAYFAYIHVIDAKKSVGALIRTVPGWKPVTIFLILCWAALSYSISVPMTVRANISITLFIAVFFVTTIFTRRERLPLILDIICGIGLVNGLYIIMQYFDHDPLLMVNMAGLGPRARATAVIGNPNTAAGYLVTILPVALALLMDGSSTKLRRGFLLVSVSGIAAGIFFTLTITGIAAAFASLAAVTAIMTSARPGRIKTGAAAVAIAAIVIVSAFILPTPLKTRLNIIRDNIFKSENPLEHILTGRYFIWRATTETIGDFPVLGTGTGTFMNSFYDARSSIITDPAETLRPRQYDSNITNAHNEYLELASNNGLFGLLIVISVAIIYLSGTIRACGAYLNEGSRLFFAAAGLTGAMVAIAVNCIANFYFHSPASAVLGVLIFAFSGAAIRGAHKHAR